MASGKCVRRCLLIAHLRYQYLQTLAIPNIQYRYMKIRVLGIHHPQFTTHVLGTGFLVNDDHISSSFLVIGWLV